MAEEQFKRLGTYEGAELPKPENVETEGFREQVRIWQRGSEPKDEAIRIQMRATYDEPFRWSETLAHLSATIAGYYGKSELNNEQIEEFAATLLLKAAALVVSKEKICAILGLNGEEGAVEDDEGPSMLPIPDYVMERDDAVQVYSVWALPSAEDCEDCGEDHPVHYSIAGLTTKMENEAVGRLLADMASTHCHNIKAAKNNEPAFHKACGEVMKGFNTYFTLGLPRA